MTDGFMQLPVVSHGPRSRTPVDGPSSVTFPKDVLGSPNSEVNGLLFVSNANSTYPSEIESVSLAEATKRQRFQCLQCGKIALLDLLQEKTSDNSSRDGLFSPWTMVSQPKGFASHVSRGRDAASGIAAANSPFEPRSPRSPKRLEMSSPRNDVSSGSEVRRSLLFCGDVFERISTLTNCDYPLCPTCCALHLKNLDEEICTALRNRQQYQSTLSAMVHEVQQDSEGTQETLDHLFAKTLSLQEQLENCELEIQEAYQEKVNLERQRRENEKRYALAARREVRSHVAQMFMIECKVGLGERVEFKQHELRRLLRTNILNEAFYVDARGPFSFINGLKLLRAPNLQTPQHEINAAWFYMAVFLKVLSEYIGLEFTNYLVRPNGNWSTIYHVATQTEYELYLGARVWFAGSRHEKATAGFVTCARELVHAIKQKHPQAGDPPVDIGGEGSGPFACFLKNTGSTSDEAWYIGMKALIMTLKWCLYIILTMPR